MSIDSTFGGGRGDIPMSSGNIPSPERREEEDQVLGFVFFWVACFFFCFVCPFIGCICETLFIKWSSWRERHHQETRESDGTDADTFSSDDLVASQNFSRIWDIYNERNVEYPPRILESPKRNIEREETLIRTLAKNRMVIIESDITRNVTADLDVEDESDWSRHTKTSNQCQDVTDCCAICLDPYEVGDVVLWSANAECHHAFHEDCIMQWLLSKVYPACPCCRQLFVDPEEWNEAASNHVIPDNSSTSGHTAQPRPDSIV
mmetsp:Transcript_4886/g.7370  ORF Transcript_4886/g.7370 Transcript_4886/m.7370 type:complete len:262 (-) Transcript_4886:86-871(-)|eukprot:CAMPEP_0196804246 /NCGR_PEP_ID=MMETSP1362-20130617/3824_1 /TAXON_ID=163516 /ORGANISM="Leptocylindrus danicus, Strain CCMP1856" /LENGTH=261 /DNA_ID=CAMNT_0042176409 /DNA_START=243 /DNA_END=1028 /DNA_ORIENTATION=+